MLGLSVANVIGVPAATWLGQQLGWRSAFWAAAGLALLTVAAGRCAFVPALPGDPEATGRRELRAFREPQVWLTLLAGAIGFGGMFAVYSYIAPTVTEVGGLSEGAVPVVPAGLRPRHGRRHLARRRARRLVGLPARCSARRSAWPPCCCSSPSRRAARLVAAAGRSSWSPCSARCSW